MSQPRRSDENPDESPRDTSHFQPVRELSILRGRDLAIVSVAVVSGALLTGISYSAFLAPRTSLVWGWLILGVPAISIIVALAWSFWVGAGPSSATDLRRGLMTALGTIVVAPACYVCLVVTCTTATTAAGVGLHFRPDVPQIIPTASYADDLVGGAITCVVFFVVTVFFVWLVCRAYYFRRVQRLRQLPPSAEDAADPAEAEQ